mmetsp:Transcript_6632/g.27600  ORF Transcript_6632/g.27600 Transcript_6632/m.27600 type:complete len:467 (-) Transcript_6632:1209-2609(-)
MHRGRWRRRRGCVRRSPPCCCSCWPRSRWAAGSAPITRCWPATSSRPATAASGGRSWTSPRASASGANSASALTAATSASRRWPPSTWPTASVPWSSSRPSSRWRSGCALMRPPGRAGCWLPRAGNWPPACPMSCWTGPSSRPWPIPRALPRCWACSPSCSRAPGAHIPDHGFLVHRQCPGAQPALAAVLPADQAARRPAHRVLRRHRHGPGRARPAHAGPVADDAGCHRRHLAGRRRRRRLQLPDRRRHRCPHEAHRLARHRQGRAQPPADPGVLGAAVRYRHGHPRGLCQRADDVADLRHLRRLCGDLHRHPEADDTAEHRHRRRLGRDAAGAGLGRAARRPRARALAAVPDHLPVDAAALLGPGPLPRRRLRPRRPADAAGHPWQRLHAAADPALHLGAVRGHAAALPDRHERLVLSGQRRRAGPGLLRLCLPPLAVVLGDARAADLLVLHLASVAAVRSPAD